MLCIIKYGEHQFITASKITDIEPLGAPIDGWIIATDMHDARNKAPAAGAVALAAELYPREFMPKPGKYLIAPGYVMLVD